MTLSAVATRYAHALADVVTSPTSQTGAEQTVSELRSFEAALRSSLELQNALTTPAVPAARKRAVVGKIAGVMQLSRISRNFLFVLVDHRRITSLSDIIHSFEVVVDERLGFARAEISSPDELSAELQSALNGQLERLSGKRIRARYTVDASLIGGAVARIGSTVYDGSVRGQLQSLERRLSAES
jgi:F-type H+-transporting ATPase subunit delta